MSPKIKNLYFVLLLSIIFFSGCLTPNKNLAQKKVKIEEKKKHFMDLRKDITLNEVVAGMQTETIRESYGTPDDIFTSGSSTSHFEVWTYEYVNDKPSNEDFNPIRLYFTNNKLISWNY